MTGRIMLLLSACLLGVGCGEPANLETAANDAVTNAQATRPTPPRPTPPRPPAPKVTTQEDDQQSVGTAATNQTAGADDNDAATGGRITADEYVDAKHQRRESDNYSSNYVRTVVNAYSGFGIQDKVALDQVKKMLVAYETLHGRMPRTHEEGMEALKGVRLPELDDGCKYVYDPDKGALMVEHPR